MNGWRWLGRLAFWVAWPALWVYLRDSQRSRVLVLNDQHEVLVVKGWLSGNGKWNLPGGGLHPGEEPAIGASRELQEETGLLIAVDHLHPLSPSTSQKKSFRVHLQFFGTTVNGRPTLRRQRFEIIEVRWLARAELTPVTADEDVLLALEQWPPSDDFATM